MKLINGLEFNNDESVIGKWENIGWISNLDSNQLQSKSGEFEDLYFLENGEAYWIFEGWTKGTLLICYGGDSPVLSYQYEIKIIDEKELLFLYLEDRAEVFKQIDHLKYKIDEIGRHDRIDLPFEMDEEVLGIWKSCSFVDHIEDFKEDNKQDDWWLKEIEFLEDGNLKQYYMDEVWNDHWTKNLVLSNHRKTAGNYQIKRINHTDYLFIEWKMGDYIYGGIQPSYYVFERRK